MKRSALLATLGLPLIALSVGCSQPMHYDAEIDALAEEALLSAVYDERDLEGLEAFDDVDAYQADWSEAEIIERTAVASKTIDLSELAGSKNYTEQQGGNRKAPIEILVYPASEPGAEPTIVVNYDEQFQESEPTVVVKPIAYSKSDDTPRLTYRSQVDALEIDPNDRATCFRAHENEFYNRCAFSAEVEVCKADTCQIYHMEAGSDAVIAEEFDSIKAIRPFSIAEKTSYPYRGEATVLKPVTVAQSPSAPAYTGPLPEGYVLIAPDELFQLPQPATRRAGYALAPIVPPGYRLVRQQ